MQTGFDKNAAILITGAKGFIGRNLSAHLKAEGYTNLLLFDRGLQDGILEEYAAKAEFVFHLAGVNRPKDTAEFYEGNTDLTGRLLLSLLDKKNVKTPVLITSSTQVESNNDYGKSKALAEAKIFNYANATGASVYVYRLPGVFGKWCRPNYNSVVATFCHNIARSIPIEVRDASYSLPLIYIDDVLACFVCALNGQPEMNPENPGYCLPAPVYTTTLGQLASLLQGFKHSRTTLAAPNVADDFSRKLYACYLSYIPDDDLAYPLSMNIDERGSFTEFLKTPAHGQVSVNIAKPGIVKGNHWHHTKNEKFLVVHGEAAIRFRKVGEDAVQEYFVCGNALEVIDIPTGYTHNIENIGKGELVTIMWASELFNPENPDTYFEKV